jgi:hypothetical protein
MDTNIRTQYGNKMLITDPMNQQNRIDSTVDVTTKKAQSNSMDTKIII